MLKVQRLQSWNWFAHTHKISGGKFTEQLPVMLLISDCIYSVPGTLKELHWLSIEQRIKYKLCLLMHSFVGIMWHPPTSTTWSLAAPISQVVQGQAMEIKLSWLLVCGCGTVFHSKFANISSGDAFKKHLKTSLIRLIHHKSVIIIYESSRHLCKALLDVT